MQAVKPDAQNRDFCLPHLHSTSPLGGFPSEYCYAVWHRKTRMAWLPDGGKILMIRLFVLTELTNVTDEQTDRQTDTAWRHKPRLHSIARQKSRFCNLATNRQTDKQTYEQMDTPVAWSRSRCRERRLNKRADIDTDGQRLDLRKTPDRPIIHFPVSAAIIKQLETSVSETIRKASSHNPKLHYEKHEIRSVEILKKTVFHAKFYWNWTSNNKLAWVMAKKTVFNRAASAILTFNKNIKKSRT